MSIVKYCESHYVTVLDMYVPLKHAVKTTKLQNYALRNETATTSEHYTIEEQK